VRGASLGGGSAVASGTSGGRSGGFGSECPALPSVRGGGPRGSVGRSYARAHSDTERGADRPGGRGRIAAFPRPGRTATHLSRGRPATRGAGVVRHERGGDLPERRRRRIVGSRG